MSEYSNIVRGTEGDDKLRAGAGDEHIDGGKGWDTLDLEGKSTDWSLFRNDDGSITLSHALHGTKTVANVEGIWFAGDNAWNTTQDWIAAGLDGKKVTPLPRPDPAANVIAGTAGDDCLVGTAGDDRIEAGKGNDGIRAGKGNDFIDGGDGWDTLDADGKSTDWTFTRNDDGTVEMAHAVYGTKTVANVEGVWFAGDNQWKTMEDWLKTAADDGDDSGDDGAGGGDDIDDGDAGDGDTGGGAPGKDILGTAGDDCLVGTDGDDRIEAGAGNDFISAGKGDDTIDGGKGWDTVDADGKSTDWTFSRNDDGTVDMAHAVYGTKTLKDVEGVWFAGDNQWKTVNDWVGDGKAPAPKADPAKASVVGADSMAEGQTKSYKVELDKALDVDTYYTITVENGTAKWVDGATPGVDKQDIMWGGYYDVRETKTGKIIKTVEGWVPLGTYEYGPGKDRPMVGPADASWDFSTFQNGKAAGTQIVVKIPAGETSSDAFEITAWKEKITLDGDLHKGKEGQEGVENFKLSISDIEGAGSCDVVVCADKTVEICDVPVINKVSPIALDLDGSGMIEVTGDTSSIDKDEDGALGRTVEFDIDGDGDLDTIEWFAGTGDGILVDMTKVGADGSIDGKALFGDEGGKYANGYQKLALLDADGDGFIAGAELDGLGLWVDNGDAVLQDGELKSAAELGIASISTHMEIAFDAQGRSLMQSSATTADGHEILSEDVWFRLGATADPVFEHTPVLDHPADACCQ